MTHFTVTFRPDGQRVSIHAGASLVEAASQAGIILNTACGGRGTCGKCTVLVGPNKEPVAACQYTLAGDLTVEIPVESRFFEHKILREGVKPSGEIALDGYRRYAATPAEHGVFGLAVDVGTTTVVAKLVDMATGECLAAEAALNPQTQFGEDVVSRITFGQTQANISILQQTIVRCVARLLRRLCDRAGLETKRVCEMCVVGNTTMNHLFLGLPVEQVGRAPYRAYSLDGHDVRPGDLGLEMNPDGNIRVVENIAGFVGADTVGAALALDMDKAEQKTLVVDIGTNGELVLGTAERLVAASCAAGPAFEGARISQGGRAGEGAIEAVIVGPDDIDVDVIGGGPARSICGSGLIDAVAVLLNLGIVDATGRFVQGEKLAGTLPEQIIRRLVERDGQPAFCLAWGARSGDPGVILTQKDIREVQLAKAAIRAGIAILLRTLDTPEQDLLSVRLAGAFGTYIRRESAIRIGLLPDLPAERISFVGNAALSGAEMILLSSECRQRASRLARSIEYVEIAHRSDFADVYAECMTFPAQGP